MDGATFGGPIRKNRIFSFTSFEQWNDKRPLTIVRTVPTELERRGDFSQSLLNGRVRTIYNPFASSLDATGRVVRPPFANNTIPAVDDRSGGGEDAGRHPAAERARQHRQLAGQRQRERRTTGTSRSAST